jgi:hypothetical protein
VDPDAPNLPPPPPPPQAKFVSASDIRKAIQDAMATAIADPSSAEAMVPIVLMIAGEYVKHVQHLRFDVDIPERALDALEKAVRRLATTVDMPAEVLLGQGDLNHWSLYGIEEQAVRWHAKPEMETICDAFTQLLRPLFTGPNTVVWYDTSDVDAEPDQIEKVRAGYQDGVVNADAYMRQLGLGESDGYDLTTSEGWKLWATDQVRRDATLIPVLTPILRLLVPNLAELTAPTEPAPATRQEPPAIEAPPAGHAPPDTRDNALTAAAGAIARLCVNQALRLAGNRRARRPDHPRFAGVPATDYHLPQHLGPCAPGDVAALIEGWDEMVDDDVCENAGLGRAQLRDLVQATASAALTTGARPVLPRGRP